MEKPPFIPNHDKAIGPFRKAVIRGLGILFPPLLTVIIFLWVINTTWQYVIDPVNTMARQTLVRLKGDIREDLPLLEPGGRTAVVEGQVYYRLDDDTFVPIEVYELVRKNPASEGLPQSGRAVYGRYVDLQYLRPHYAIPCFLAIFVLLLYILGKFMAAGIGGLFWNRFEGGIHRLPLVRNVYSAVKQVTDFFFSEQQIQFKRVVAVEYPRHGMWSMAFVTSDGLADVRIATNEPVLGVFIPTSPMPMSGYALTVLRREVVDLSMTVDQALQFIVSCGLVIPPQDVERMKTLQESQNAEGRVQNVEGGTQEIKGAAPVEERQCCQSTPHAPREEATSRGA
jgi:uncharacterized membrane protein